LTILSQSFSLLTVNYFSRACPFAFLPTQVRLSLPKTNAKNAGGSGYPLYLLLRYAPQKDAAFIPHAKADNPKMKKPHRYCKA
jgi:hypothetical protein